MARLKTTTPIPTFPAPTPHKIGVADVYQRGMTRLIVTEAPKNSVHIECRDITTGKIKTMLKHVLEERYDRLGTNEAGKCARALVKMLKSESKPAKSTSNDAKTRKPRAKKAATDNVSSTPGFGSSPVLN